MSLDVVTIALVNASSGLAVGMSSALLADVLPWAWARRNPWVITIALLALWVPAALSDNPAARRLNNSWVNLYLCALFLAYILERRRKLIGKIPTERRNPPAPRRAS